jgi:hypothetical protein
MDGPGLGTGGAWITGLKCVSLDPPKHVDVLFGQVSRVQNIHVNTRFMGKDGELYAHSGMICTNEYFANVMESMMTESQTMLFTIPDVVSLQSFLGFLEWLYTQRFGVECSRSDGRELYILAEMYTLPSLQQYLVQHCINNDNLIEVCSFMLLDEGVDRNDVRNRCIAMVTATSLLSFTMPPYTDVATIQGMVRIRLKTRVVDERLTWKRTRDCYWFIESWARRYQQVTAGTELVASELDLIVIPLKHLRAIINGNGYLLVNQVQAQILYDQKVLTDNHCEVEYIRDAVLCPSHLADASIASIALYQEIGFECIAVVDRVSRSVSVLSMDHGNLRWQIMHTGVEAAVVGRCVDPMGIAFNATGDLFVSCIVRCKILIFNRHGVFVREFGERGRGVGDILDIMGLAFTIDWNLVATDSSNHRIQIFHQSGVLIHSISMLLSMTDFSFPRGVSVAPDDTLMSVGPYTCKIAMFTLEGGANIVAGNIPEFEDCNDIALTSYGNPPRIVGAVSDSTDGIIQLFYADGTLIQTLEGFDSPYGLAFDKSGRLFVGCEHAIIRLC